MGMLILASYFFAHFFLVSLPYQQLSLKIPIIHLTTSKPSRVSPEIYQALPQPLGEIIEEQCQKIPSGFGIPGFQPGITKKDVLRMLGTPTRISSGYWPNTRAVSYELIPSQVSLGFLFDRRSQRIRQTEASFINGVDSRIILMTLNGMLGCKLNPQIHQGLQQVQQGKFRNYYFKLKNLEGIIEKQKGERLYIGIWEEDLH